MRKFVFTIWEDAPGNELAGEPATTPTEFAECWGEITPANGREYPSTNQMQSNVTHKIRTEFVAGVNPRMRLTTGERTFNVVSVTNVEERNRELEWMCTEVV